MIRLLPLLLIPFHLQAQDTLFLKVHFLYGSIPARKYRNSEPKWFGGKLGGHVGVESDSNKIVNFLPSGKFHVFSKQGNRHSTYSVDSEFGFYSILGTTGDSVKKTIFYIPINNLQKQKFDSISAKYLKETPYDYAFFGMRCGAAAYDILSQLGIFPAYSRSKMCRKIFYPKKLRKRLFKKAIENNWTVVKRQGSIKRKWERDGRY